MSVSKTKRRHAHIVVDGRFLREQASEAVKLYFAPFSGVMKAATGDDSVTVRKRAKA